MADRSVVVKLVADAGGYITSMGAAAKATADFGVTATTAAAKHKSAWEDAAKPIAVTGAALVALAGSAIYMASEFDAQMSVVKANVDDKSAPAMQRLADAALNAGRTTVFSATEAAKAEEELAKAGMSAAEITGGALTAALSLASAGQIDLGTAAEITASTMTQFGLKAADAAHIADVLAAGADKSLGGVIDLSEALKYSGVSAAQFGISLDETVGVLADFASNGILGSMAGTSLREMLTRLASPTKEAKAEMQALGLTFFDAQGNFLGVANMAEELKTKMANLTVEQRQQALASLFGSRSMAEANILFKDGAEGVNKWTHEVNDQNFATEQAATKMDNLNGDLTKLKNSLNAAMIEAGQGAQGPLRNLAQGATDAVNAFSDLPPAVQSTVLAIAGIGGSTLLAVAGFVSMSVKIGETIRAFKELEIASKLSFMAGPLGVAIGVATVAMGLFVKSEMDAAAEAASLRQTLDQTTGAITQQTSAQVALMLQQKLSQQVTSDASGEASTLASVYAALGVSLSDMTGYVVGNADAIAKINGLQQANADTVDRLAAKHGDLTQAEFDQLTAAQEQQAEFKNLAGILGPLTGDIKDQAVAQKAVGDAAAASVDPQKKASDASTQNAQALKEQEDAANAASKANDNLIKSLTELQNLTLGARGAEREFQAAIDDAAKSLKENGRTLDDNTDKGRANAAAIDKIASSTLANVAATFKSRDSTQSLTEAVGVAEQQVLAGRQAFLQSAQSMGMSSQAANALANKLGLTTQNVDTLSNTIAAVPTADLKADDSKFKPVIFGAQQQLSGITRPLWTVTLDANTSSVSAKIASVRGALASLASGVSGVAAAQAKNVAAHGGLPGYATGGYTGNIPENQVAGLVHGREFVLNAATTERVGLKNLEALNSGQSSRMMPPPSQTSSVARTAPSLPPIQIGNITTTDTPRAISTALVTEIGKVVTLIGPIGGLP